MGKIMSINRNSYRSGRTKNERRLEEEGTDDKTQGQKEIDRKLVGRQKQELPQQCQCHFSANESTRRVNYSARTEEPITSTNFFDNILLKSVTKATRGQIDRITETREPEKDLSQEETITTRNCKNIKCGSKSNTFEQQQKQHQRQHQIKQQQQQQPLMTDEFETDILRRDIQGCCRCDGPPNKVSHSSHGCSHVNCSSSNSGSNNNKVNTEHIIATNNLCHRDSPPSLNVVYLCLGTLALAVATLAILFHSHVSNTIVDESSKASLFPKESVSTPIDFEIVPFVTQFRSELLASDDILRSMVAEILKQQQQSMHRSLYSQQTPSQTLPLRRQKRRGVVYEGKGKRALFNLVGLDSLQFGTGTATVPGKAATTTTATMTVPSPKGNFRYQSENLPYDGTEIVKNERKFTRSISSGSGGSISSSVSRNVVDSSRTSDSLISSSSHQNCGPINETPTERGDARIRRDISSPSSMHADSFIEFFNPNHRKVLEEQDMEIRKRTGLKGAAPGGDEWIYLNTYCRVPEKIITGFCKGTQNYCPPSPPGPIGPIGPKGTTGSPGLPGIPGPKGNRGDVGLPGPPGVDGGPGAPGPRGPKGDIGVPGRTGLDGRDGVPGEPGLDGVPGRAGADGIPGKDGLPGRDGRDGQNGKDGKDGAIGPKGAAGPPGERGLKGIAGPRGRPGKAGTNGTPGIPGINAWKVQLQNGSFSSDLLVPPSIADLNDPHIQRTIIVEEGKTLNLSCAATGHPVPHIEWRRDDGRTINVHGIEMSSVSGPFLKFTNITRNQMSAYTCYASNGIAPVANATFLVEVHFSPMISIYRQMIYAEYGHAATLECLVEAFPEAIRYWERAYDGRILDPGEKYRIETYPDGFKTTMRLTINNLRKDDFGYYHCVARNELNATMVNFEIAPQDPNSETPYVGKEIRVYGQRPPESECPTCEQCPDPSLYQCKDVINTIFEIQPTGNGSYPGLPKRQKSCLLYAVGKPVFHKAINEIYGCWLKDAAAKDIEREKTFFTKENDTSNLYEFSTKMQFRLSSIARNKYEIPEGFHGNAHIVYNGSFYYHQVNTDKVVKLNLNTMKKIYTSLPYSGVFSGSRLYSTEYNFMDFNVDEVGLWIIYSTFDSNNTLVAKLDAENLKIQYNFNITLDHHKFGEMFIVCGHLYAIDSCTDKNSQIRYVVDLYNGKLLNVDLPFSNPFRRTTTVGYNPFTVELYSMDKGNALTYPIRYHEQPLNSVPERS